MSGRFFSLRALTIEHWKLLGERHGVELLVLTLLGALLATTAKVSTTIEPDNVVFETPTPAGLYVWALLFAIHWSFRIWRRHGLEWHAYRALPVAAAENDRARVLAAALWLVLCVGAMLFFPFLVDVAGPGAISGSLWMLFLTGPLTVFLLGSACALRAQQRLPWVVGLMAVLGIVGLLPRESGIDFVLWPLLGPIGVGTALYMPYQEVAIPRLAETPLATMGALLWAVAALGWMSCAAWLSWRCAGDEGQL